MILAPGQSPVVSRFVCPGTAGARIPVGSVTTYGTTPAAGYPNRGDRMILPETDQAGSRSSMKQTRHGARSARETLRNHEKR